jgi:hypothetical protein
VSEKGEDDYAQKKIDRDGKLSLLFQSARVWNWAAADNANAFPRNSVQNASIPVLAGSYSILFAIEDLMKNNHLFAAELLLRPLLERVGLLYHFQESDESVARWERGWEHKEPGRPSITTLIECIPAFKASESEPYRKVLLKRLHALVHPDPIGSLRMIQEHSAGITRLMAGPADNRQRYVEVANDIIIATTALLNVTEAIFPKATWAEARLMLRGVGNA